jgi:UDP-N-acetylmuramate dehydrogenase
MKIYNNHFLKKYNTFGTNTKAKYFVKIRSVKQLREVFKKYPNEKTLLLGEGSNTLLVDDWDGLVLKIELKGKTIVSKDKESVEIKVASGENWDKFVRHTVKKNLSGIENLVLIPGTVGAAVAQNVGAYGQEVIDTITSIETLDTTSLKLKTFSPKECDFRYRNTHFKNKWKGKHIITSATFKLKSYKKSKQGANKYQKHLEKQTLYEGLNEELKSFAKKPYTVKDVMNAVIKQREKKLPSLKEYGTCGSFFENPIVTKEEYERVKKHIPDLTSYPVKDNLVKIPAGKLLDELGWKSRGQENVGVYKKHALCVVSNKKATGKEIYEFIKTMQKDVKEKYGITLTPEVNIIKNQHE